MNSSVLIALFIVIVVLALVGRCDVRRAASGQPPDVATETRTEESRSAADASDTPAEGPATPAVPPGCPQEQKRRSSPMAWRPTCYLMEGELDNTQPGKVTGWLQFIRMKDKVVLDLAGDFHRDIRGTKVVLTGRASPGYVACMRGFSSLQTGKVGDMTAGLPPHDYVYTPYFEWYSQQNGRVLLTSELCHLRFIGRPLPPSAGQPISRLQQDQLFAEFLRQYDDLRAERLRGKEVAHWIA